ncbi:hypothetical protein IMG5_200010 [Ichthyophthirius multifiliis]|uniref:Glutamyl/glutaminyl-tRNA synthetase class Ib catalytic domain-containing protein n=1 Tax=Ichthyophthirius multifiliis TaxID=5932 RepID=G0R5P2_ICHMU|nr:hypothetical protein IMG5_200010 [Ichthyophthirius multifiliis]EGR27215.1 hypothetical protein IMG5_200010 [Ichthyophthirius multifiliis]|eukprot:XP_004024099.1 hypothetical protein IMG5_200010 [Ichthyophthirius multifiliis]
MFFKRNYSFCSTFHNIRVRYSLNPYNHMNMNHLRSAILNFIFARSKGGSFVLRIDDLDQKPNQQNFFKNQINILQQSGIQWDEGPYNQFTENEGKYGPYFCSQRKNIYQDYSEKLIKEKKAFRCFCSHDEIKKFKQMQQNNQFIYEGTCLKLTEEQIEVKLQKKTPYTVRLNTSQEQIQQNQKYKDSLQNQQEFQIHSSLLTYFVIIKTDGNPTFPFANAVDDYVMKFTHIIRENNWMRDIPKQKIIYQQLGIEYVPIFMHLPDYKGVFIFFLKYINIYNYIDKWSIIRQQTILLIIKYIEFIRLGSYF